MRRQMAVLLVAFLAPLAMLRAEEKKPAAKDEDKILGTWKVVSAERGGEQAPEELVKTLRLTFAAGGKLTVMGPGENMEGTFKLNTAKKPKQIDFTHDGKTQEGIYELDGDTLKLCVGDAGSRPAEFKSPEGSKAGLMTFQRLKK